MPRVFLTGFMGCGKSTSGKELARLLELPFCDLDEQIEKLSGQSIPEIFRNSGEAPFRDIESQALRELPNAIVCALGGGTVLRPANLHWIKAHGLLIYLKVAPQELTSRISNDVTHRPLLEDPSGQRLTGTELIHRISAILQSRTNSYEAAHRTVEATHLTPLQTAQACIRVVEEAGIK